MCRGPAGRRAATQRRGHPPPIRSRACTHDIDREMRAARTLRASNPGAADDAWGRIDQRLTDQAPWLPLYNPRENLLTSERVGNY